MPKTTKKEPSKECPICCSPYTKKVRKEVECLHCGNTVCTDCIKNYMLTSSKDYECMFDKCHKTWSREFVDQHLTASFRNGILKKHREDVLVEREMSFLPAAQAELSRQKDVKIRIGELNEIENALLLQLNEVRYEKRRIMEVGGNTNTNTNTKRKEFVRKCPYDECRGFLSSAWKCGTCDKYTCKECYEPKNGKDDPDHECTPENVETAKLLAKETKPCPKCGILTFKIAGCSLMWCTQCHTAWSWTTGQITTERIHNPHYYEWQRRDGGDGAREPGDIICGGMPTIRDVQLKINTNEVSNIHRFVVHSRHVLMPGYNVVVNPELNRDLQFKYLENKITKEKWKSMLVQREKKRALKMELYHIVEMVVNVGEESFRKICATPVTNQSAMDSIVRELRVLRTYTNDQLTKISKRYNATVIHIDKHSAQKIKRDKWLDKSEWNAISYKSK